MPRRVAPDIHDFIEPETNDEKKFDLNLKQLNFIRDDNNITFMKNIMKVMKTYNLEVHDINTIIEDYHKNEIKKQERNEARRIKRNEKFKEMLHDSDGESDEDELRSNLSGKTNNRNSRRSKRSARKK